jgi:hypothetical protein
MRKAVGLLATIALIQLDAASALAQRRPHYPIARVGQCVNTRIVAIHARLEGDTNFESGIGVELANGIYGVSYESVRAVRRSRVGDRVRSCLVSIPHGCPPGDDRGREYRTLNLRTRQSWTLPDSQHSCGGA